MPQTLKFVAQLAMDDYFQNYKGEADYWDIEDFVFRVGNTVSAMYWAYYQQEYAMLRQDKKEEVVTFDTGWLLEQVATVTNTAGKLTAQLTYPIMTFPYDKSSVGIQNVFITNPQADYECERISLSTVWQTKYWPKTNRIAFYGDVGFINGCSVVSNLSFINKGSCNIKQVLVSYVPSMFDGAIIPDGLITDAISKTVTTMKQMASGQLVQKLDDFNPNKIAQNEVDKTAFAKA